jgi:hypothetical protein
VSTAETFFSNNVLDLSRLRLRAVDAGLLVIGEDVQVSKANGSLPN